MEAAVKKLFLSKWLQTDFKYCFQSELAKTPAVCGIHRGGAQEFIAGANLRP